jgi:osmotically-inducible protein OsmY
MATCIVSEAEDVTLGDRVRDRLDQSGHAAMRLVSCSVEQGRLRLSGRTRTYYLKQLAQEIARATPGVTEIANDIRVRAAERASRD